MLLLLVNIGGARFGVDAKRVVEVIPCVELGPAEETSRSCVGRLNYHGSDIPVFDLNRFLTGESSERSLTTRIVVLNKSQDDMTRFWVGFLAEEITETVQVNDDDVSVCKFSNSKLLPLEDQVCALPVDDLLQAAMEETNA